RDQVRLVQWVEDDHFVNAVEELRAERVLELTQDAVLLAKIEFTLGIALKPERGPLDKAGPDVRGHDDDRVLEVHLPPQAVRQYAIVQHLQQHIEEIRMGLLDLI